ncbi:GNAT family N-acetyltransferase [Virgibacillus oceani]|uniref:N-acetyltransferase n=1 Tax=Virgibacillus oceani TaxID=1479511 RepID=A0A917M2Y5_9BACI|nr:GNAT family N-acetyltransferase [Virgibacillus oceani]GGG74437.1 N-acetyltransferase [Virgibacillus oceani]
MVTIRKGENKFFVGENEKDPLAEITFVPSDNDKIIIEHTFVSEDLRGEGVAGKLVEKAVNYARDEGKKIIPECSYAKKKMENTPAYHDVLAK